MGKSKRDANRAKPAGRLYVFDIESLIEYAAAEIFERGLVLTCNFYPISRISSRY
jgi:hypothetical protein